MDITLEMDEGIDAWPAARGIETLLEFEEHRLLTQRALQKALANFQKHYWGGTEKVLEIGSGLGFLRQNWPSFQGTWVQLEPQRAFLKKAAERLPSGMYVQGSVYGLPVADQSFDIVGGYGSFDVFSSLEQAVKEVDRVLKHGGLFFHMLDVGSNHDVIRKTFEQKRIPLSITRKHSRPYFPGMPSAVAWDLEYIPPERLPAFLQEVGMTAAEMDAHPRIGGDFAYPAYVRKIQQQRPRKMRDEHSANDATGDDILDEPLWDLFNGYHDLFRRYALKIDADTYFREHLLNEFSSRFGKKNVTAQKVSAFYQGKRTEYQNEKYPSCFAFQRTIGRVEFGMCTLVQWPFYKLHQLAVRKNYGWAPLVEPTCIEMQMLDVVIARKP